MAELESEVKEQGRYLYCVAEGPSCIYDFGNIGIEGKEVYIISTGELCAVVHNCRAEPYKSDDEEKVKGWVKTHQEVIDRAAKKLGTVVPFSFDVIIKGEDPNKQVLNWLKTEEESLKRKIEKIKDKQEFGIQIFFDKGLFVKEIMQENIEIQKLQKEITQLSKGKAYFHEQKIKEILKRETEKKADVYFKNFYEEIRNYTNHIRVERVKEDNMLINFSCLVHRAKIEELGMTLDTINKPPFSVKFTGPWPAYSFVN